MNKFKVSYVFLSFSLLIILLIFIFKDSSIFINNSDEGFDSCQEYDCVCEISRDKQSCQKKSCIVSYQVPPVGCGKVCADECKEQCQNKDIKSCESPSDKVEE